MTTKLDAIRAIVNPCLVDYADSYIEFHDSAFGDNRRVSEEVGLLLAVAEAAAEEYAAQLAYLDAYSVIIKTDADADAFGDAAARFDTASEALFAAIAPLMKEAE